MNNLTRKLLPSLIAALPIALGFFFSETAVSWEKSSTDAQAKTVIEMTVKELRQHYGSELSGLKFDLKQDSLGFLLTNVGNNVEAFFRDLANTASREKVQLHNGRRSLDKEFNYLVLPRKSGFPWTEDRTDKEGRPVDQNMPGYCISRGYAYMCIYLHPDHQKGSIFRYLGRVSKKPGAHVIAFAQKPETKDYLTGYIDTKLKISMQFLVQGFIWLDPDSYQILRMKTGMLSPDAVLKEQTTDIYYQKVRFTGIQQPFWLPKEVNIRWELPNITYQNKHKYSDFHLFSVETGYKIIPPKTKK
jgi:hypothetical protein